LHSAAVKQHRHCDQAKGDHYEDDPAPIEIGFVPARFILFLGVAIELSHKAKTDFTALKRLP
jgi:hypothetical protein